jgi:hypothetical protein
MLSTVSSAQFYLPYEIGRVPLLLGHGKMLTVFSYSKEKSI